MKSRHDVDIPGEQDEVDGAQNVLPGNQMYIDHDIPDDFPEMELLVEAAEIQDAADQMVAENAKECDHCEFNSKDNKRIIRD